MAPTLLSINLSGDLQEHARLTDDTPCGLGVLPDGTIVVLTMFRNGSSLSLMNGFRFMPTFPASPPARSTTSSLIGLGRAYVGDLGFNLPPPPDRDADGRIILVTPDGEMRVVAEGLRFPNGIAVSADHQRLVVAEMDDGGLAEYEIASDSGLHLYRKIECAKQPDGICLDREGAVWIASYGEGVFTRIDRNGREQQRIYVPGRRGIACALGGFDRRTLFCISAATSPEEQMQGKSSARIDLLDVEIPGAGYP